MYSREFEVAALSQTLKEVARSGAGWKALSMLEREEIEITLARVANQCIAQEVHRRSIDDCTPDDWRQAACDAYHDMKYR
jgi:hypothetical protein